MTSNYIDSMINGGATIDETTNTIVSPNWPGDELEEDADVLLVLAVLAAGVEAQLPLQLHPVRRHEELVRLDILSCEQTRDRGDILSSELEKVPPESS